MSLSFLNQLDYLIRQEIAVNPRTLVFSFAVDTMSRQAHLFSTSKFSSLLNLELLNNLLVIATTQITEPQNIPDAIASYRKGALPLSPIQETKMEMEMDTSSYEESPAHPPHQTSFQSSTSHMTDTSIQTNNSSIKPSHSTPTINHQMSPPCNDLKGLTKERIQSLPTPQPFNRLSDPPKRKRSTTPNQINLHQPVKETIDNSTKLKIMSALNIDGL
ncbi:Uncharacterized protein QTN25_010091 [Entamoeba marina]